MLTLRDLLRTASRTFAIGIEQLPGVLCDAGTVAYLLLRVSDYLEDNEDMPAQKKIVLLNLWAEILKGNAKVEELTSQLQNADTSNPDAVVAQHTEDILARLNSLPTEVREIILHHVMKTTYGMARWVERGPQVMDEADMDDYMFEVAGRVGYLLTHLFAWYSSAIRNKKDNPPAALAGIWAGSTNCECDPRPAQGLRTRLGLRAEEISCGGKFNRARTFPA